MPRRRTQMFGPLLYSTLGVVFVLSVASTALYFWQRKQDQRLVDGLRASDPLAREVAGTILAQRLSEGSMPLGLLIEAARDTRSEVRSQACKSLVEGEADPSKLIPVLIVAAGDDHEEVRIEAARGLGAMARHAPQGIGEPPVNSRGPNPSASGECILTLRSLLKDRESSVRAMAADSLARFRPNAEMRADLIAAMRDGDRDVRFAAARALLKLPGTDQGMTLHMLITLLVDPEPIPDRSEILDILNRAGEGASNQAITALIGMLSRGDPLVLPDVIDCLRSVGPRARGALPALEALFKDENPDLRASSGIAILAIEDQQNPRAAIVLAKIVTDVALPRATRESAAETGRSANPAALAAACPDLISQLGSRDPVLRRTALDLLSIAIDEIRPQLPSPLPR